MSGDEDQKLHHHDISQSCEILISVPNPASNEVANQSVKLVPALLFEFEFSEVELYILIFILFFSERFLDDFKLPENKTEYIFHPCLIDGVEIKSDESIPPLPWENEA